MKELKKIKLGALSKSNLEDHEMGKILGGTYCYWGDTNYQANDDQGLCSCYCAGHDVYSDRNEWASWDKQS